MKKTLALVLVALLLVGGLLVYLTWDTGKLVASRRQHNDALIAEKMAEHIGVLAYLYGYPLVDMARQMHNETHRISEDQQTLAPVNRFYRFPDLVTPQTQANFRAPNNDTLYYTAWYDVREEPLVIHTPDTGGRYFTIAVTNQFAEVTHIGRRTTGTDEQYFALTGPGWQGTLPPGVQQVPVDTPTGWLLGRMLVDGKADFDEAMALVNAVWAAGLSEFTPGLRPAMPTPPRGEPLEPLDSLAFFDILNSNLRTLPRRLGEDALMAQFDAIGVGPGVDFDAEALSPATRQSLLAAIDEGRAIVEASTARTIADVNGWMISRNIGRYGFDYMHRASVARGGYGNLPEESLYPATLFDAEGAMLSGEHRYRMHFAPGQLPPVDGFWSLSVYTLDAKLAPNPIERYSIGDRSDQLQFNSDGSLTLYLQHTPPDEQANWLPTPAGHFLAVMRLYEPAKAALTDAYQLPRIERVEPIED
ncbi:DUF1254 domain-containing protein [Parahaliea mediterranea]|uniref:DUF1254 domain-containing protein n=1 Tax=Parahaliea mediterranea TaxID=651086 RepID=UPI001473B4D7|nr:DUF1214 domain-containing protein [Parahaliea mediterranea]